MEVGLHLFGVLGGSGLSVIGGHMGVVVRRAYLVSGFMRVNMVDACGNVAIEKRGPLEAIAPDADQSALLPPGRPPNVAPCTQRPVISSLMIVIRLAEEWSSSSIEAKRVK